LSSTQQNAVSRTADSPGRATKRRIDVKRRAEIGRERRARTRANIHSAAFELLGRENGLYTSIDEICAAAGVSRGTFYNYFNSTQELFESLCYELSHDFMNAALDQMSRMADAAEATSAAVRFYLTHAARDPQWGWGMVNISRGGPIFGAETHAQARKTIQEGLDSGEFDVASADIGRDVCLGTAFAAMITLLREPQNRSFPGEIAKSILIALGVAPARAARIGRKRLPETP
jgi:AcrR family transcriptional regulator